SGRAVVGPGVHRRGGAGLQRGLEVGLAGDLDTGLLRRDREDDAAVVVQQRLDEGRRVVGRDRRQELFDELVFVGEARGGLADEKMSQVFGGKRRALGLVALVVGA